MKQSRVFLFFSLTMAALAILECLLSFFFSLIEASTLFLDSLFGYTFRTLALVSPFLALGTAIAAVRVRSLSYALSFVGIYAATSLFAQIPLSLLAYDPIESSAPYALLLFSYMIGSAATALIFLLLLVLVYAVFLEHDSQTEEKKAFFSWKDAEGRALSLSALLITLYQLVREAVDFLSYAKARFFILSAEDFLSLAASVAFFLLLGVLAYAIGRAAPRFFPIPSPAAEE